MLKKRRKIKTEMKICKPIELGVITSGFGERLLNGKKDFHFGIDIAVVGNPPNIPIFAAKDGIIKWVDKTRVYSPKTGEGSFGCVVYVLGQDGWYSMYPHMDSIDTSSMIGVYVKAGTKLGIMGNTGYSFGQHLHYQERKTMDKSGESRNPIDIVELYENV
jgi:murein DD-endopeptidase MepM/ murein hydrolase activator NlpD